MLTRYIHFRAHSEMLQLQNKMLQCYVEWNYEAAVTYWSCSSLLQAVNGLHFIWNSRPHSLPETCFLLKRNSQSQTEKISTFLVPLWKNDYSHVTAKWASIFWAIARRYQCLKPTGTSRLSLGDWLLFVAPKLKTMPHFLWPEPLSAAQLKRLEEHKYSASGRSLFEPPCQIYWNWLVQQIPTWVAPNTLTIIGLVINIVTTVVLVFYCPTATEEVSACDLGVGGRNFRVAM